jgi:hypothetical protein
MADTQAVLGAVALIMVAVALILALTMLVLIEARWTLRLWASLRRSWTSTIRQVQDADTVNGRAAGRRGDG